MRAIKHNYFIIYYNICLSLSCSQYKIYNICEQTPKSYTLHLFLVTFVGIEPVTFWCRCRVGENWWFRGEHCEEYVSEPLVVGIAIASVAGFLMVAAGIIFFLARSLREQYDGEDTEDPLR